MAASEMHFEQVWGLRPSPTPAERDAHALHATQLFLRAYARDPDALIERGELAAVAKS